MFGLSEIAIILIVVIAVLCAKKLPELTRSAGKSARILRSEAKAMKQDGTGTGTPTYTVTDASPARDTQGSQVTEGTRPQQTSQGQQAPQDPPRA